MRAWMRVPTLHGSARQLRGWAQPTTAAKAAKCNTIVEWSPSGPSNWENACIHT